MNTNNKFEKMHVDWTHELPWRVGYTESLMSYAVHRRVERYQLGGARDSQTGNHGARLIMSSGFSTGEMVLLNPTKKALLNGMEEGYVNASWGTFVEGDGEMLVLDHVEDGGSMEDNLIIVHTSAINRGTIYATRIPKMIKHHAQYGIDIIKRPDIASKMERDALLYGGERLAHNRNLMESGDYGYGRLANFASVSSFSTNEDTCCVLDTVPDDFATVGLEDIQLQINNDKLPLNKYGDADIHRAIPTVGTIIEDGVVAILRERNVQNNLVDRCKRSMRKGVPSIDVPYFCRKGGEVISVEVIKSTSTSNVMNEYLPNQVVSYLDSLSTRRHNRYRRILELDKRYKRDFGTSYKSTPSWNMLVTEAMQNLLGNGLGDFCDIKRLKWKGANGTIGDKTITGYLVNIKVRSVIKPNLGHKFNDPHGAKYTISEIRDKHRMFKDKYGRIAEFVTNGVANINRGIWDRLGEPYRADALFHLLRNTRRILGDEGEEAAIEYYLGGIDVISEKTAWQLKNCPKEALKSHLHMVLYVLDPTKIEDSLQVTDECGDEATTVNGTLKIRESVYEPPRDTLTFTDHRGREVETINPIRISGLYISVNEKMGNSYSACNIPMKMIDGLSRKMSSSDKRISQVSPQGSKVMSEADFRNAHDNLTPEEAQLILRDGTSSELVNLGYQAFLNGDYVPTIDATGMDARGMEMIRAELSCDGVTFENIPREIKYGAH